MWLFERPHIYKQMLLINTKARKEKLSWYKNTSPQAKPKASWLGISNKMEQPQHAYLKKKKKKKNSTPKTIEQTLVNSTNQLSLN